MTADEARMTTEKMVDELLLYTVQFIDEQIRATAERGGTSFAEEEGWLDRLLGSTPRFE